MNFDFSKLIGKIKELYPQRVELAKVISLSNNSLSKKLNNKVPFTSEEIVKLMNALDINYKEVSDYFFKPKVEKMTLLKDLEKED